MSLRDSLSRLAALYPDDGELMASSFPADFIDRVIDEIVRRRTVLDDTPENVRAIVGLIPADAGLALSRARKILAALRARAEAKL